jgi:hypothetical protein
MMRRPPPESHRPACRVERRRGQVLPIMAGLLFILVIGLVFFFNVAGFDSVAINAMDNSLDNAASAGLLAVTTGTPSPPSRINPAMATTTVRNYAGWTLYGLSPYSSASYQNIFTDSDLAVTVTDPNGTSGDSQSGLDVEILNPATNSDQVSERFYNCASPGCDSTTLSGSCSTSGTYPEQLYSSLTGSCYDSPTVILRLRLTVFQLGPTATLERTVVLQGNRNAP